MPLPSQNRTTTPAASATVAIIAALPRELALLTRGLTPDPSLRRRGIALYRLPGAVAVAAGMGADRATLAVEAAMAAAPVRLIFSTGLAGACTPHLAPGSVIEARTVVDARTGERLVTSAPGADVTLVSSWSIASVAEKKRLAATYGADAVDMEAATVARLAAAHGIPFRAVKGISDAHDFEIAALERFTGPRGEFRTAAFALHTALRPHLWTKAARLGAESKRALRAMTAHLRRLIADAETAPHPLP